MNNRFPAFTTFVLLAAFVACSKETTTETSTVATSASTETVVTTDTTMTTESTATDSSVTTTVATPASDGTEQIKEGAKQIGQGLKEEARQATAVAGAALERGGEKLQQKAEEATQQKTAPAPPPAAAPATQPPAQVSVAGNVANGASVYKAKCVACHGADTSGNTAMGKKNKIPDLRSAAVQGMTDAQLGAMIATGKPGGTSASAHKSKALTQDQIKDIIAYLRSIRQ